MDIIEIDIRWHDATANGGGWETIPHLIEDVTPEYCLTRGYLVHEDEDCLRIAQTLGESGYLNAVVVPRGCIKWEERKHIENVRDKEVK